MAEAAKKKTGAKDPMEAVAKLNRSVQAKQRVKEEAAANDPVQLPMWDDDLRGVPNCLAGEHCSQPSNRTGRNASFTEVRKLQHLPALT